MTRVLHVFPLCGRAGTEAVIRFLIQGLAQRGVRSEAFFQRDTGGRDLFDGLCPIHFEHEVSLAELLASGRFDAIHAITSSNTIGLTEAVRRTGFTGPIIAACHNDYVVGWNRSNAQAVVALTEWWAQKIRPYTDLPVRVIGNPVDLERFQPETRVDAAETPILAWIGRSRDPQKNVERLRQIIAALPPGQFRFFVADTDLRDRPEELFGELASRVSWYGRIPYPEMPAFYRNVAASGGALLSTADEEAFPMSVLEAMASGCPVIVPDAWGSDELVHHQRTGWIYQRSSVLASLNAALADLRDPAKRAAVVAAARARVETEYHLTTVTDRYMAVFEEAAQARRAPSLWERALWAVRSAAFYLKRPPRCIWLYRPRIAAEALDRAVRDHQELRHRQARSALLSALRAFPPVYLKPWRFRFLLRTLAAPDHE